MGPPGMGGGEKAKDFKGNHIRSWFVIQENICRQ